MREIDEIEGIDERQRDERGGMREEGQMRDREMRREREKYLFTFVRRTFAYFRYLKVAQMKKSNQDV